MNDVIECLNNHRSIRKFKPDAIDPEMLDAILTAGIRGATGGNLQLLHVDRYHNLSTSPKPEEIW